MMETTLPKHLLADVEPMAPARVRVPQVRKQRFSRTPREAAREDGVDTRVVTRRILTAHNAPTGSRGTCACGGSVTKVWHPVFGDQPKWIHDHATGDCPAVMGVHSVTRA